MKLHKSVVGSRFVTGGNEVMTTPISKVVSVCLRKLYAVADLQWNQMFVTRTGISVPRCPILMTADELTEYIDSVLGRWIRKEGIQTKDCVLASSDFAKLYPSVPQEDLIAKVSDMINLLFAIKTNVLRKDKDKTVKKVVLIVKQYPECGDKAAEPVRWGCNEDSDGIQGNEVAISASKLIEFVSVVVKNSFVTFGGKIHQLVLGIPTGTNCAPELTNLWLLSYEFLYYERQLVNWDSLGQGHQLFLLSYKRYIDDIFKLTTSSFDLREAFYFDEDSDGIFPKVLNGPNGPILVPLKVEMEINKSCDFLDLALSLDDTHNRITYELFDKRRAMKVGDKVMSDLRNFPHLDTLLARTCKLGVVTSQMHRFNRRCFYARDFINETVAYCRKLIREGYSKPEVLAQVGAYKHWVPSKGRWQRVRAILKRRIQLLALG